MSAILQRVPITEHADEVHVGTERIAIRPYQMLLWVSVTGGDVLTLASHAPRLPALLDTGHNHNFSIREDQLADWAQIQSDALQDLGSTRVNRIRVALRGATVWIHPNESGSRMPASDRKPFPLRLEAGIAVHPRPEESPRLPLLGIRALVRNGLFLTVDANGMSASLRSPDWRTRLMRWLS